MSFDGVTSQTDLSYTFHFSKLSCWRPMYFAHIAFAYLVFLAGIAAFVTRLFPKFQWLHLWMGRLYIIFMLWATGTAILIHNTGTPVGVIWSFLWVMLGLTAGWLAITIHQKVRFKRSNPPAEKPSKLYQIFKRMFSLKGFHGCIMFVSWINIAGRCLGLTWRDFECFTYPAYKQVQNPHFNYTAGDPLTLVEANDPKYNRLPWANREGSWAAMMLLATYAGAFVVSLSRRGLFIYLQTA